MPHHVDVTGQQLAKPQRTTTQSINLLASFVLATTLTACTGPDDTTLAAPGADAVAETSAQDSTPQQPIAAQGEVTDEKIGLPPYSGAKEVDQSRIKLHSDTGDTYSIYYQTTDTPTQVAAFYQAEAAKLGTLKESLSTNEYLKSVTIERTDGTQSMMQARIDDKGTTLISIHRFIPNK